MDGNPKDARIDLQLAPLPPEMHAEEWEEFHREYLDLIYNAFRLPADLFDRAVWSRGSSSGHNLKVDRDRRRDNSL